MVKAQKCWWSDSNCIIQWLCHALLWTVTSNMVLLHVVVSYFFFVVFKLLLRVSDVFLIYIVYRVSQEECPRLQESVPYVKVYRYNPKHLYPKLPGYGDNGQRKVRSSCGSTYYTFSADALHVLCTCRWNWNAVNIMPACPCKVLGNLRTATALMRVFM